MALADLFDGIADAIREKDGTTEAIVANTFPARIRSIPSGGSSSLTSISITTPPKKTEYIVGETFDPSGLVVTAAFSDGASVAVDETGISFAPSGALNTTDTQITVSLTFGNVTKTAVQPITVISSHVFGVKWNAANQGTAMTRLTTASDPNGFVNTDITAEPVPAVGTVGGSSPFDDYLPWKDMDEYNIINGVVTHKRGDAGFSRSAYDTMVYIPEFWFKVIFNGNDQYFYVSDNPKDGFEKHPGSGKYVGRYNTGDGYVSKTGTAPLANITRAAARTGSTAKGNKWCQYDFASWCAVEYLFRVEFADWDSQSKVGRGYVDGNSAAINNGGTDSMSYHTGRAAGTDGKTAVQYRHIENPWGNVFEWIDGINFNNRVPYICIDHTKYADDTETNYTNTGVALPATNGFITNTGFSNAFPWALLPTASGGSETTYIPDYVYSNTGWRVLSVGGNWGGGSGAGLWCVLAGSASSYSHASVGARLLYNP